MMLNRSKHIMILKPTVCFRTAAFAYPPELQAQVPPNAKFKIR